MAQDGRGEILKNQGQFTEAREAFQSALEFIDQGAKADSGLVTQKSAVYLGIVGTYKKQYDLARAKDEALKIFAPVMKQATEYRNALRYEKALPLYLSLDGIAPYLPSEFFFIVKTGEGEMLMFGKQWPEAREFFRQAVSAQIGAGGTEQWQGNVRLLQQMAARSLALSFKLQGQVENNAAAFAQARKSYAELLARPDLNAAVRADAESDMKQLPPAPETPSVAAAPATP